MTNQEIKELLQIFEESGVAEMEVQRGENRLRLRRALTNQELGVPAPMSDHSHSQAAAAAASTAASSTPAANQSKTAGPDPNHTLVKSPIVGTYYDAPSPGA